MQECLTAEDVREAARRRLEWRKKMFTPEPPPLPAVPMPEPPEPPKPKLTAQELIAKLETSKARVDFMSRTVRWMFNISETEWHADRRSPRYVFPHWVAIYTASKITDWSLAEIGRRFKRDHTSVIHTIDKLDELRATDDSVDYLLTFLERDYVD